MRYLSVCSGIEAASVAWEPLGWEPAAFSEIEAFPRAVLAHHFPTVPLHGDFTTIRGDEYGAIDLVVGGTPCQSFSLAGLREGMADPRGNLALGFCQLIGRIRPRWLLWENVPGILSSDGGRDFASILGALAQLRYGFAWRVLDAANWGVPQRRRRVFLVGHSGDWRRAAAALFERSSLLGDSSPCGGATVPAVGSNAEGADDGLPAVAQCLTTGTGRRCDAETETLIPDSFGVRHLTVEECETLQGFPRGWTRVPYRGRAAEDCPFGPRYKAVGNSMAVPVVRWIGERIQIVDGLAPSRSVGDRHV